MSVSEKGLSVEVPDIYVEEGELAHVNFLVWRNSTVLFKIRCHDCGGKSVLLPLVCDWVDGTKELKGVCTNCQKPLLARVHFFLH